MPANKLKIRKLKASEVTFTVTIEQDDLEVRGNAMSSDDPDLDRKIEDEILAALDRGNIEAWCCVKVTATWEGLTGVEYLGACSFRPNDHVPQSIEAQIEECVDSHGLRERALEDLNAEVERQALKSLDIINRLKVAPKPRKPRKGAR